MGDVWGSMLINKLVLKKVYIQLTYIWGEMLRQEKLQQGATGF